MFGFWAALRGFFDLKSELKEDRALKTILAVQKDDSMKIFAPFPHYLSDFIRLM